MSPNYSGEVVLNDGNIERGIPAEELMDEANMFEQADGILFTPVDLTICYREVDQRS
ncbi:hypothetical protein LOAG_04992 [Loa loa]|uniref:Uncharacterized protein n=1 Tax=Loa loa TaxID=7209 RepID=A0A1S0U0Y8_LOALO|nr:hypothetical protein LOAG_04992 [Loa loa]EFO23496.2 hypothetical protein LOAG_04992 [Loa loa]